MFFKSRDRFRISVQDVSAVLSAHPITQVFRSLKPRECGFESRRMCNLLWWYGIAKIKVGVVI